LPSVHQLLLYGTKMIKLVVVHVLQVVSLMLQLRVHGSQLLVAHFKALAIDLLGNARLPQAAEEAHQASALGRRFGVIMLQLR
jgi:hypothetical protein